MASTSSYPRATSGTSSLRPLKNGHLAPFPEEIPLRALALTCPERVCPQCARPIERQVERGLKLNMERPQAKRALARWQESGLTPDHLAAVRAIGINDVGKSLQFQNGAGKNGQEKQRLAREAKDVMRGYFRELTFALPEQTGWKACACGFDLPADGLRPGLVLDPFVGTGTTLRAAQTLGRRALGFDLRAWKEPEKPARKRALKRAVKSEDVALGAP